MSNELQRTTITPPDGDKPMSFIPYGSSDAIKLSVSIIQNLIAVPTKSGKTCSKRDALRFMMMCQARRLNPFEGDAFLVGYDGKNGPEFSLITAHQAFLKRAEIHPEYDGMQSGIIILKDEETGQTEDTEGDFHLPDARIVGGWATVYFKTRKYPTHRRIRMDRFNKGFAQWGVDAAGMICKCAEADALRSSFPTMLGGLYLREETTIDVSPMSKAGEMDQINRLVEVVKLPEAQTASDETAEADAGLAPQQSEAPTPPKKPDGPAKTAQVRLMELVTGAGFTFDDLKASATLDADALTGFRDVKTADAERLLKVDTALLAALGRVKKGAV